MGGKERAKISLSERILGIPVSTQEAMIAGGVVNPDYYIGLMAVISTEFREQKPRDVNVIYDSCIMETDMRRERIVTFLRSSRGRRL